MRSQWFIAPDAHGHSVTHETRRDALSSRDGQRDYRALGRDVAAYRGIDCPLMHETFIEREAMHEWAFPEYAHVIALDNEIAQAPAYDGPPRATRYELEQLHARQRAAGQPVAGTLRSLAAYHARRSQLDARDAGLARERERRVNAIKVILDNPRISRARHDALKAELAALKVTGAALMDEPERGTF
jgi:hypothetical protein